ncbi:hypothetical protein [Gulosibacter molinativorax]|uniref:hypothetical protein n=1 Tax=Gulosibacter molinativorax TaxID=256821 RepID=UPI0011B1F582|nr:hypothetical protein [Gulosibacter molinativorax]QUY62251.1 Hypotetical protein [Gulosibacter molinativorax]
MSTQQESFGIEPGWWRQLELRHTGMITAGQLDPRAHQAALDVLRSHPPIAFSGDEAGQTLNAEDLAGLMGQAREQTERELLKERDAAAKEQRRLGWQRVEDALTADDANETISEGRWAGFSRGEARAWCWSLFEYEPHGFVHPGSQLRHESLQQLQSGAFPEVFGYPERACALADRGLTPREYRRYKELLGRS